MAEFLDDQDTRLCDNCKKEIPVCNFTIHEIHCQRNIGICPICKEPFPKSEMEIHTATEHCQVTCKCNKKFEKMQLKKHEETECPLRLALCQHCDLELSVLKLKEHEDYCGARTELCSNCGRNVLVKDLKTHPEVCGRGEEEKRNEVEEQERQERSRGRKPPSEGGEDTANLDFMLALSLQNEGQASSVAEQQDFWRAVREAEQSHGGPSSLSDIKGTADETMLPCEFCEELYPEELLIDHQTSCNPSRALPLLSTPLRRVEDPDVIFQSFLERATSNQLDSLMGLSDSPPVEDSVIIPCEFCGVQLEEEVLFHHQDQCDQRPATANHMMGEIPRQDSQPHETSPELPRRRVRHQGDLSSDYMDAIKQEAAKGPTYPLPPSRPINNMTTSCNRLSKSTSAPRPGYQPSPPHVLKLNNSDSQDIRGQNLSSRNGALAAGSSPVIDSVRSLYPENLMPSFPRGPAGRYGASGRSEGARSSRATPAATDYHSRTAKAKPPKQQGAGDAEEEEEE
ncbi:TRAF-type zinc finger domain-containing protein 1 [Heterocephalus glaber]|uniref:TRAF-type zinc finger domain-containing protein 1 n=1 Tax=Heterocephalus glaber TaxID=10181 RepID=G5AKV3_HETGA|nr:TRAF-type zinc finger domain-containing protein 1 [Heterocephalus glaber]